MKGKHIKKFEKDFAVRNCSHCGANFCIQTWSGAKMLYMDTQCIFIILIEIKHKEPNDILEEGKILIWTKQQVLIHIVGYQLVIFFIT